ncbi:MAG: metal-dependent hydrolase [Candidatus Micrarchaeia archaeon]
MNFWTHLATGTLIAILLTVFFPSVFPLSLTIFSAAALGSLLPDVDHKKSKVFKATLTITTISSSVLVYRVLEGKTEQTVATIAAVLAGVLTAITILFLKPSHRGVTHSFLAAAVFSMTLYLLATSVPVALVGFLSYASHLVLDAELKLF